MAWAPPPKVSSPNARSPSPKPAQLLLSCSHHPPTQELNPEPVNLGSFSLCHPMGPGAPQPAEPTSPSPSMPLARGRCWKSECGWGTGLRGPLLRLAQCLPGSPSITRAEAPQIPGLATLPPSPLVHSTLCPCLALTCLRSPVALCSSYTELLWVPWCPLKPPLPTPPPPVQGQLGACGPNSAGGIPQPPASRFLFSPYLQAWLPRGAVMMCLPVCPYALQELLEERECIPGLEFEFSVPARV